MNEANFTFRLDEALKSEFTTAAKSSDRNAAQVLRGFMGDYVRQQQEAADHDAMFRRQVQIGIDAANAGDLISAEEVGAEAAAWREATRQRLASHS